MGGTPFYIGQSYDHVIPVCKRTNRKRISLEVVADGETYRIKFKKLTDAKVQEWSREQSIRPDKITKATVGFSDGTVLVAELNRGLTGKGPLIFRVTEIRVPEAADASV